VTSRISELLRCDLRHVWHPYAPPSLAEPPFLVESAHGVRLQLADGRVLIDGMSSWWAAIHGYGHPALNAAIEIQLSRMAHVMFGGLTNAPAIDLCTKLVEITPGALSRVFLCDSGSVSIEVAIKLALQYAQARGMPERSHLLTVRGGYHGDTFGAMAVSDPVNGMHTLFRGVLAEHFFADMPGPAFGAPWNNDSIQSLEQQFAEHGEETAAVILEPIVQGAGGMRFYHPEYLRRVRALCSAHDVLLIADEIATGFGRTGELFGCDHAGVAPDIMCVGKALTGGMLTLAAVLCTDRVADAIACVSPGVLMHGPTFMGNPLACSVALASITLLLSSPFREQVKQIERQLSQELAPCRGMEGVTDVRVLGAIGVIELDEPVDMALVQPALVDEGVWLRPFGRLLYTMPPFITEPDDITRITKAMRHIVERYAVRH
jgi:adenosylmethionine-8-amino-7-oxononanoate aminotransferase